MLNATSQSTKVLPSKSSTISVVQQPQEPSELLSLDDFRSAPSTDQVMVRESFDSNPPAGQQHHLPVLPIDASHQDAWHQIGDQIGSDDPKQQLARLDCPLPAGKEEEDFSVIDAMAASLSSADSSQNTSPLSTVTDTSEGAGADMEAGSADLSSVAWEQVSSYDELSAYVRDIQVDDCVAVDDTADISAFSPAPISVVPRGDRLQEDEGTSEGSGRDRPHSSGQLLIRIRELLWEDATLDASILQAWGDAWSPEMDLWSSEKELVPPENELEETESRQAPFADVDVDAADVDVDAADVDTADVDVDTAGVDSADVDSANVASVFAELDSSGKEARRPKVNDSEASVESPGVVQKLGVGSSPRGLEGEVARGTRPERKVSDGGSSSGSVFDDGASRGSRTPTGRSRMHEYDDRLDGGVSVSCSPLRGRSFLSCFLRPPTNDDDLPAVASQHRPSRWSFLGGRRKGRPPTGTHRRTGSNGSEDGSTVTYSTVSSSSVPGGGDTLKAYLSHSSQKSSGSVSSREFDPVEPEPSPGVGGVSSGQFGDMNLFGDEDAFTVPPVRWELLPSKVLMLGQMLQEKQLEWLQSFGTTTKLAVAAQQILCCLSNLSERPPSVGSAIPYFLELHRVLTRTAGYRGQRRSQARRQAGMEYQEGPSSNEITSQVDERDSQQWVDLQDISKKMEVEVRTWLVKYLLASLDDGKTPRKLFGIGVSRTTLALEEKLILLGSLRGVQDWTNSCRKWGRNILEEREVEALDNTSARIEAFIRKLK